jgi:hypothetical protein
MKRLNAGIARIHSVSGHTVYAGAALFFACIVAYATVSPGAKTYPSGAAKRLIVSTESGPIDITGSIDAPITVDVTPAAKGDDCIFTQELRDGTLYLDAHAEKNFLGMRKSCSAGFAVSVNADTVQARSGSGDVSLGGLYKKADVRTGSGSIRIVGAGKRAKVTLRTGSGTIIGGAGSHIDAESGSGDIELSSLTGIVKVRTGSGAVSLDWTSVPEIGDIDVRTGSGDLAATLPPSARLMIDFKSGSGRLSSEFGGDARAPLHLTFRSGSGGAAIKKKI